MNKEFRNIEKQTIKEAIKLLSNLTGSKVIELPISNENHKADANLLMTIQDDEYRFNVEIKGEIRQNQALGIIEQFGKNKDSWLLVARYIPRPLKDYFKAFNINYLELTGNCYISRKGIFIYITDRKVTPIRETIEGKLWKPVGLKFLVAVISNPELLQASYREIAKTANIALGNIGPLFETLQKEGYAKKESNTIQLLNKSKLITRWTEMYHAILRPKLLKGKFRFLRPEQQLQWRQLEPFGIYWGAEPAAALLTNHFRPEVFTIYTEKSGNDLLKQLKIVPDGNGNITVLDKFWGENFLDVNESNETKVAPALVVYADLINGFDSRNQEIAERIKKKYLSDE